MFMPFCTSALTEVLRRLQPCDSTLHSIYTGFFFFFVSSEQGKVLKVLHTSEGVFIISQYSMFHNEGPVLNMAIDPQKV